MRISLTNILLFLTLTSYGQTDLGIGLVSINFNDSTVLHFYDKQTDKEPKKKIEFFFDTSIKSLNIRNFENHKEWLKPEILWLDYSTFDFRCKKQSNEWYEVIVNNENGQTFWIRKSYQTMFSNWETYLINMFGVERLPTSKQEIRKLPSDSSEVLNYSGIDCFKVRSMKGDWIEIFTADYYNLNEYRILNIVISGWIKWKNENNLLIGFIGTM